MAGVSNDKIYELVDRTRRELKGDITRLESRFDGAEGEITRLRVASATLSTKVYVLVFIITTVVSAIVTSFFRTLIK